MDSELEPIHTLTDFIRFQKLVFPATEKQSITGLHALPAIMAEHDFFRKHFLLFPSQQRLPKPVFSQV
jgi:hypothetical protein